MSLRTTASAATGHEPVAAVGPPGPGPAVDSAATAQFRPNAKYVLMLGLMCALPAVSTDMYLPSLPDVARDLGTSATAAQLTMTAMLIGGAVGQLVIGPLSDRFGRRKPVLIGVVLHVITSLLCAIAPAIVPLIALRTVQGFFNASATVVAMAIIRDRFVGADASRLMSRLMLVIGVAPLFAPSLGGVIAGQWGWRSVFVALAGFGVVLWVVVWRRLPETLPPERRRQGGLRTAVSGYRSLLRDRHFVALAILPGLGMAVLMSYVVASPFVLREGYGLSATEFSLLFAVNGIGLVLGAQVNASLVRRVAPIRIVRVVLPVSLGLTGVLLALALTGWGGLIALLVVLWLILALVNFVPPNASALALTRHGEIAGTAAAVIGSMQAGVAGLVSPLSGLLGGDAVAMAAVMVGASVAGLLVLALATPAYRRDGAWAV
ncbi:multidrug effflux MFS transporter [Cellulomonas terrae]|uniref:Putative multidrug resistance transporter, Bcr/CflA family protein n=1 Tax=Cellulomonas terrae TaxID=311234 RepID=A0A511JIX0_9CELL|nr:multidrug effflux MFS transporter [Cellulomonas terrae]GEL97962.1 putative multidrug resistance transporter, Bcr/CflA family protein [Cellulomonas terrae]